MKPSVKTTKKGGTMNRTIGLCLLAAVQLATTHAAIGSDLGKIKHAWRKRQSSVRTARFFMKDSTTIGKGSESGRETRFPNFIQRNILPPKHTTKLIQRTASFNPQNIRATSYGQRWNAWKEEFLTLDQRKVFTPKEARTLNNWAKKEDAAYPWGVIESGEPFSCSLAMRPLILHYRPFLPIHFFRFDEYTMDKDRSIVKGRSCVVLRRDQGLLLHSYFLDPKRAYAILRYTSTHKRREVVTFDVTYAQDKSHKPVPKSWKVVRWSDGKLMQSNIVKVLHFSLNVGRDPSEFRLEFPVGTMVLDMKRRIDFLVRKNGAERIITRAEKNRSATYTELLATKSGNAGLVRAKRPKKPNKRK